MLSFALAPFVFSLLASGSIIPTRRADFCDILQCIQDVAPQVEGTVSFCGKAIGEKGTGEA